jgi:hypothetical protein
VSHGCLFMSGGKETLKLFSVYFPAPSGPEMFELAFPAPSRNCQISIEPLACSGPIWTIDIVGKL